MSISLDSVRQISKNFQEASNKSKGSSSDLFMKLVPNKANRIRIVGELKAINASWIDGVGKLVIPQDYIERVEAMGHEVRQSVVCNVIDRSDEKLRFKILEKGPAVFRPIITRFEEVKDADGNEIHPGGPAAGDWLIKPVVKGNKPRDTSYEVQWVDKSPITKEEKKLIARSKDPEKYKDLPLGEKGLIDLDIMYSDEKALQRLKAYLEQEGEEVDGDPDTKDSTEADIFKEDATDTESSSDDEEIDDEEIDDEDMF